MVGYQHVQDSAVTTVTAPTATGTVAITPTAGNLLVVFVSGGITTNSGNVSDDVEGTQNWMRLASISGLAQREVAIWIKLEAPNGLTTITVTSIGFDTYEFAASEFSGLGKSQRLYVGDQVSDVTSQTTHQGSALGMTFTTSTIFVVAGRINSVQTECNPGTGYTEVPSGYTNGQHLYQWKIAPGAINAEVGAWSNTGSPAPSVTAMVAIRGGSLQNVCRA